MDKNNNCMSMSEKEKIIEMHVNGFSTVDIARSLNRCNTTIGRYLKKCGYKCDHYGKKIPNEERLKILELYMDGMTSKEIYKLYSHKIKCEETIQVIVRNAGISRRKGVQNPINHCYFKKKKREI